MPVGGFRESARGLESKQLQERVGKKVEREEAGCEEEKHIGPKKAGKIRAIDFRRGKLKVL